MRFACTCGSVLGPSAIVAESADAESSKHRNLEVPPASFGATIQIAPVRVWFYFDGGIRMYAVIRTGGKQYRVTPGDVIRVESQANGTNGQIEFGDILAVSDGGGQINKPEAEARVVGEVVEEGRGKKILVFHYKRKKQYKKLRGHRQEYTAVRITEIAFGGQKFTAPELPKKQPKAKKVAAEGETHAVAKSGKAPAKKKAAKKSVAKKAAPKKKK
jgi:large subunit ribosomal protein L21